MLQRSTTTASLQIISLDLDSIGIDGGWGNWVATELISDVIDTVQNVGQPVPLVVVKTGYDSYDLAPGYLMSSLFYALRELADSGEMSDRCTCLVCTSEEERDQVMEFFAVFE